VGELDEVAFAEAMAEEPDEALGMLADLAGATDEKLRALARRLAGRERPVVVAGSLYLVGEVKSLLRGAAAAGV